MSVQVWELWSEECLQGGVRIRVLLGVVGHDHDSPAWVAYQCCGGGPDAGVIISRLRAGQDVCKGGTQRRSGDLPFKRRKVFINPSNDGGVPFGKGAGGAKQL